MSVVTVDITSYIKMGNVNGIPLELDDGSLVVGTYAPFTIQKSVNGGFSWQTLFTDASPTKTARLNFIDSRGYIYYSSLLSGATAGYIKRSVDNGVTWTTVLTGEASGFWYMVEDANGYLYASEYSSGLKDANELYAYHVWRSTDGGSNWSKWFSYPAQSTPGAKDSIRHIHAFARDSNGNFYIAAGDSPEFSGEAGNTYQLTATPALGTLMSSAGNGWISFVEAEDGGLFFGQDGPVIYKYNRSDNSVSVALNINTRFGGLYGSPVYSLIRGKDGVLYACNNNESGSQRGGLFASPDDGANWYLLSISGDWQGGTFLTLNARRGGSRLYVGRSTLNYISVPDFTRSQLNSFLDGRTRRLASLQD